MKVKVSEINVFLVGSALLVLNLGWPLFVLTGIKLQYVYLLLATLTLFLLNVGKPGVLYANIFCFFFFIVVAYHVVYSEITTAFVLSAGTYFAVPLVYTRRLINPDDYGRVLDYLSWAVLLNGIGIALQVMGIGRQTDLLAIDSAFTDGVIHARYTGLAGGVLTLGVFSAVALINSAYQIMMERRRVIFNSIVVVASLMCILLSFTRRYYVLVPIIMAVILYLWFQSRRKTVGNYLLMVLVIVGGFCGLVVLVLLNDMLLERILSIFDFQSDIANRDRVTRWNIAWHGFITHWNFGMSPGATGTVGAGKVQSSSDYFSAESFYLKMLMETGLWASMALLTLLTVSAVRAFRRFRQRELLLPVCIFLFYLIEATVSTSMEAPFSYILFMFTVGVLYHGKQMPAHE